MLLRFQVVRTYIFDCVLCLAHEQARSKLTPPPAEYLNREYLFPARGDPLFDTLLMGRHAYEPSIPPLLILKD